MAFTGLFGKKKGKDAERRADASSDAVRSDVGDGARDASAVPRSRRGPNTRSPPTLSPRDVARQTAEKIDLIESQIESEIMASRIDHYMPRGVQSSAIGRHRVSQLGADAEHAVGQSTDVMLGDSDLAHSMVINDSANPVQEEAAILYANGQDLPAVAVLSDAVKRDRSRETWLMLLELYQSLGQRADFERLAIEYAVQFETSAPAWSEIQTRKAPAPAALPATRAAVVFQGVLDARIVPQLEQLKLLAQRNPVLHLSFDRVTGVDAIGANLMLRVLAAFQKSKHEVVISGASSLAERLHEAVEVGRRDEPNAVWMLLLEVYRILGRQAAFEETSIDYCVTYEVSPPPWEPASPKFRIEDDAANEDERGDEVAADPAPDYAVASSNAPATRATRGRAAGGVSLSGEMLGKVEDDLQRLTEYASRHDRIVIDCSLLVRVDFTAAGLLLNWAVGMRGAKKHVEFTNVGHLVSALFVVMGLHEVVPVEPRRA